MTSDQQRPDLFISSLSNAYRLLNGQQGTWRFEGCVYQGPDALGQSTGTPRILTLGGQRFYFALTGDRAQVFRFDGQRLVPSAIVGLTPRAWDQKLLGAAADQDRPTHFTWHDANGDGTIQAEEIVRVADPKSQVATFSCEVDSRGNLLFPNHHFQTTKFAHPHLHWQAFLATADLLRRQQKYAEAIREYEQSMQIQGLDDNALARCEVFIGECCLAMNEPAQAAEHYLSAVAKHPKADAGTKVQVLLTAGHCQLRTGNKEAARECYEQVRDLPGASVDQMKTAKQKIEQLAK